MKRRDFLMTASGVAGGTAASASVAAAQEGNESEGDGEGGGGGGPTEEVVVGPGGALEFDPADLTITPGTTVHWTWDSDNHNVVPSEAPDDSGFEGTEGGDDQTFNAGHEYEHTFEVEGDYEYYCTPHRQAGMTGAITVQEGGGGGEGGGQVEEDPEHMGVPFQAHFVGLATLLMMVVSLIYTFFLLKYGESPHTSGSNR
ncbi:halocyanin [Halobacteriales archaeon SW_6_65_15]|jgi:plastocyanin|nr:MAG: halocyanin [Halobacteriales archaeon SW_6_65_15]